ncbi:hypothetical protein GPECTOR_1g604 [Gonium pectorale]|uniref:Sel1 repeat family protein n=1 Tax=Gonium pectorale TaxID=33097 RepID=A0A150H3M2_GONPE|nr:hypothetical protein GPECTOR_1g604 [Gonium pectorale]|eukprot:KXZ56671.1 hypothetical protein GPECTOR_1g604 [Gonium pectorale]
MRAILSGRNASAGGVAGSEGGPAAGSVGYEQAEQDAMAKAVVAQYAMGSFVLPSAATRQQGPRDPGAGCCTELAAEAVVPRGAAAQLPRLLVAAAQASNPSARLVVAQLLEGSGDASSALRWWRKLAQGGDMLGMFKMGMASYDGSHGVEPDQEAAHMWLSRTVRALDTLHMRVLGWSAIVLGYLEFDGVAGPASWGMGDRSTAVRMFRLAEVCGFPEASATLGWLFNTGQY